MADNLIEIIGSGKGLEYTTKYTDIVIEVDNQEIPVHRQILAVRSEYFAIMFYGAFDESKKDRIKINNVKYSPFKAIIDYIYSGGLKSKSKDVTEIYAMARMLQLSDATEKISNLMENGVCADNFVDYINCACLYDIVDVKKACGDLWINHLQVPIDQICNLSEDAIMGILGWKVAPIDEIKKFDLAVDWLKANDESKSQLLMATIDLSNFTKEEIGHKIRPSGYFTDTQLLEAVLILKPPKANCPNCEPLNYGQPTLGYLNRSKTHFRR